MYNTAAVRNLLYLVFSILHLVQPALGPKHQVMNHELKVSRWTLPR